MAWRPRQPRQYYTAGDALSQLSTLLLTMVSQEKAAEKERMHEKALLYEKANINAYAEAGRQLNLAEADAIKLGTLKFSIDQFSEEDKTLAGTEFPMDNLKQQQEIINAKKSQRRQIMTDMSSFYEGETMGSIIDVDRSGAVEPLELEEWLAKPKEAPSKAFGLGVAKYQYDPLKQQELLALKQLGRAREIELDWLSKEKQQAYNVIQQQILAGTLDIQKGTEELKDLKTTTLMNKMIYSRMPERLQLELKAMVDAQTLKGIEINIADALEKVTIDTGIESYQQLLTKGLILDEQRKIAEEEVRKGGYSTILAMTEVEKADWEFDEAQVLALRGHADAIAANANKAQSSLGDILFNTIKVVDLKRYTIKGPGANVKSLNYYYTLGMLPGQEDKFETELAAITENSRYELIGSDLKGMVTSLVSGAQDAEKIPIQSPRHNFLVQVDRVYNDIYKPIAGTGVESIFIDPVTNEETNIESWVDKKVAERVAAYQAAGRTVPKESRMRDNIINEAIRNKWLTYDDAIRYQKYEEWDDTGIFDDISQLDMVKNSLLQQDQYFQIQDQINARVLTSATIGKSRPDALGSDTYIQTINPALDKSMNNLFKVSKEIDEERKANQKLTDEGYEIIYESGNLIYYRDPADGKIKPRNK